MIIILVYILSAAFVLQLIMLYSKPKVTFHNVVPITCTYNKNSKFSCNIFNFNAAYSIKEYICAVGNERGKQPIQPTDFYRGSARAVIAQAIILLSLAIVISFSRATSTRLFIFILLTTQHFFYLSINSMLRCSITINQAY